ncbi:ABC transporter permease [bacterium]|nr:ABC transporter permease [bacterium]
MLFGLYIAKKLGRSKKQTFTRTVVRLATAAVSVSVAVVLLSYGILLGFKEEIRNKVSGYAGHITVKNFDMSKGSENSYLVVDDSLISEIENHAEVVSVYPFLNKAGILKSDSVLEGIIFRGVPENYNFDFYEKHLLRGDIPKYDSVDSYDILLSEYTANILDVDTGSRLRLYFIDHSDVKQRRPKVVGIFNTGLMEFDKQIGIMDLRALQRVVGTDYSEASGYEVKLRSFDLLEKTTDELDQSLGFDKVALSVKAQFPTIFQWLEIVDTNVLVIIVLMFIVAIINIITVLLILVIERIPMIGLLKSLGSRNRQIMHIFSWQGLFILTAGLIIGNVLAFGFGWIQTSYHIISLTPETYYMDSVPFYLPLSDAIIINVVAIVCAYVFTLIPSLIISGISPTRSLRFR